MEHLIGLSVLICGFWTAVIAAKKGDSGFIGFLAGALLLLIGAIFFSVPQTRHLGQIPPAA